MQIDLDKEVGVHITNEEDFFCLAAIMQQAILITDYQTGEIINVNEVFCQTFKHSPRDIIGKPSSVLGIWENIDRKSFLKMLKETKTINGIEFSVPLQSDKYIHVLAFSNIIFLNGRKLLYTVITDLSRQKETEFELRKSASRYKAFFYNNAAPMAIYELDTTIVDVNSAYLRVCGFSKEEVVGMSWVKQIPPIELERLIELNKEWLKSSMDEHTEHDIVFLNKKGERTHVHMSSSFIPESKQIVRSFVDTTQKTLADERIAAQSEELKRLIEEKNKEITANLLQIVHTNEIIEKQQSELEKIKKQLDPKSTELIKDIDKLIDNNKSNAQFFNWDKLKDQMKLSNPTFLSNLLINHPKLTPAEQKLCTLLLLQLSTKEIAALNNQHYDSVRVSRTRLRKKLNLKRSDKMITYLLSL